MEHGLIDHRGLRLSLIPKLKLFSPLLIDSVARDLDAQPNFFLAEEIKRLTNS